MRGADAGTSMTARISQDQPTKKLSPDDEKTLLPTSASSFDFPGLAVHLDLHKSNISGTVAVDFADHATRRRLTGREPSRMASMTKAYTAAAVLRLMEHRRVHLDQGIDR